MIISDDYISALFEGTKFGSLIDNCVNEKRKLLAKTLRNQVDGYWSGHTAYGIVVDGGFLYDAKSSTKKKLTMLGRQFMREFEALKDEG